jgi:hypothetical protein
MNGTRVTIWNFMTTLKRAAVATGPHTDGSYKIDNPRLRGIADSPTPLLGAGQLTASVVAFAVNPRGY